MGKITGFMEIERVEEACAAPQERIAHYQEFTLALDDSKAQDQGARCMDCGTPFCNNGCPIHNVIPDFNDAVYQNDWQGAYAVLAQTNNFPEFTGRICPAPCEAACVLNINDDAVAIKSLERAIIDKAWDQNWVHAQPPKVRTGKTVAVVGSGPAGLAAAQQLARVGHGVTVFEKNDRAGGLLRYGIPDFKLDKALIERRVKQMQAEGVRFATGVLVGDWPAGSTVTNWSKKSISAAQLQAEFDVVLLAGGSEQSRDLPIAGRDLAGVHFAMEFLPQQNKVNAGDALPGQLHARNKSVVVIGGGDTGSDCVGTSYRQGARSVTQFELMPKPPEAEDKPLVWPYWPLKLRTSSSHKEGNTGREYAISTKAFIGKNGKLEALKTVRVEFKNGKLHEVPGSEETFAVDLVLLAMGFVSPTDSVLKAFGVKTDARGNACAQTEGKSAYQTSATTVFAAGDMRRGQSLVVWAIREGRQAARAVDTYLMGESGLPY